MMQAGSPGGAYFTKPEPCWESTNSTDLSLEHSWARKRDAEQNMPKRLYQSPPLINNIRHRRVTSRLTTKFNLVQSPGKVESLGKGATMVPAEAGKKLAAAMTATKGTQPESGNV